MKDQKEEKFCWELQERPDATGAFVVHALFRVQREGCYFIPADGFPSGIFETGWAGAAIYGVVSVVWIPAAFFAFSYMKPEEETDGKFNGNRGKNPARNLTEVKRKWGKKVLYGFYLIVYGILNGLGLAGIWLHFIYFMN